MKFESDPNDAEYETTNYDLMSSEENLSPMQLLCVQIEDMIKMPHSQEKLELVKFLNNKLSELKE